MAQQRFEARALCPFEENASALAFTVQAAVQRQETQLEIFFTIEGPLDKLELPAELGKQNERGNDLWQKSCFECFLATSESTAYEEWNLSPAGKWAHYAFSSYRALDPHAAEKKPVHLHWKKTGSKQLSLKASVPCHEKGVLQIGLCAVLEHMDGEKSFWALTHQGEKPDFHLRESFELEL